MVKMTRIKMRKSSFFLSAAGILGMIAIVAGMIFYFRSPRFLKGEESRLSPILKPSDLSDRSFFLVDHRYLLRLDSSLPNLRWKFVQPIRGELHLGFFIYPHGTPVSPLTFDVTAVSGYGGKKQLILETWKDWTGDSIERHFKVPVSLPAGGEIEFAAISDSISDWSSFDIGMTVPRVEIEGSSSPPSNLLMISVDALRSDFLGIYQTLAGRPPEESLSPEIDRLAENAVIFLNARTPLAGTWPALTSLHLSEYSRSHGVTENREFLEAAGDTIASLLRSRGHATLELAANAYALNIPGFEEKRHFLSDNGLLHFARRKIAQQAAFPFFHWYHLWGVHDNYSPPEWIMKILEKNNPDYKYRRYNTNDMMRGLLPSGPEEVAAVRRLYAGAVYYVDYLLKDLFDDLRQLGLWDKTMIIVTADHGEELYDHQGYFYHAPSLYDSALKVPLIIKFPYQRRRQVIKENVSLLDLLPTLHDYFIGPPPPDRFSGLSLLELLKGRRRPFQERILFAETEYEKIIAAIAGNYKLIYNPDGILPLNRLGLPFPMGKVEFYDLQNDPGETNDLAGANHPVLRRLLIAADNFLRTEPKRWPEVGRGKVEVTEKQKEEAMEILRALGYIR